MSVFDADNKDKQESKNAWGLRNIAMVFNFTRDYVSQVLFLSVDF